MRTGIQRNFNLGVGNNNSVLDYNPKRRYIQIGSTSSAGIFVVFGAATVSSGAGFRIAAGQDSMELRYEDVGDLVCQPVSIQNSGAATTVGIAEGFEI